MTITLAIVASVLGTMGLMWGGLELMIYLRRRKQRDEDPFLLDTSSSKE